MRMGTSGNSSSNIWTSFGVSACLGLAACGDDTAGSGGTSTGSSGETTATGAPTTQDATSTPTSAPTTDGPGSDSVDADTTPTSTTAPGTNTDTTDATTNPTATTDPGTTTALSASTGDTTTTDGTTTSESGTSTGGGDDSCVKTSDCSDGLACVLGHCVSFDGDCASNKDCHGDTFCCAKNCLPPGESPGVCIDFGNQPEGDAHEDCAGLVPVGLFQPALQCEWTAPPPNDPFPDHVNVLTTPLAAPLPHSGMESTEVVIVTYNFSDGGAAVACLAIGRATVPRDEPDPPALALPASLTDEQPDAPTPSRAHTPLALAMDDNPAAPAPDPKRDVAPRAMRREAVTEAEALEAAQRAVPSLRGCTGIPRHVTAGIDIVRGRGVVTALNLLPVNLDDPKSWHGCAVRSLKPVRFPVRETAGHVQIRLSLR